MNDLTGFYIIVAILGLAIAIIFAASVWRGKKK